MFIYATDFYGNISSNVEFQSEIASLIYLIVTFAKFLLIKKNILCSHYMTRYQGSERNA